MQEARRVEGEPDQRAVTDTDLRIWEVRKVDNQILEKLMGLIRELNVELVPSREDILRTIRNPGSHLLAASIQGEVLGMATLCVFHSPTGRKAMVEDVVVASGARGRHIGRELMLGIIRLAMRHAPLEMDLTSSPCREAANRLYAGLGFKSRETNCYRMTVLPDGP